MWQKHQIKLKIGYYNYTADGIVDTFPYELIPKSQHFALITIFNIFLSCLHPCWNTTPVSFGNSSNWIPSHNIPYWPAMWFPHICIVMSKSPTWNEKGDIYRSVDKIYTLYMTMPNVSTALNLNKNHVPSLRINRYD